MSTMQQPPKPNTPGSTPAPKKPTGGKKNQPPPSAKGSGGKASSMSREQPPKAVTADDMAADYAEKSMGSSTGTGGMPADPEGGDGMDSAGGERLSRLSKGQDQENEETMNTTAEQIERFQDLSERLSKGQLSQEEQQEFMGLLQKGQGGGEPIEQQPDRYQELRGKIAAGEELTKAERVEFADLLKAKDAEGDDEGGDEDEGEGDEGGDDEGEEGEESEKSRDAGVTEDELQKALDSLQSLALGQSASTPDRRAELAEKLSKGQISAEETVELQDLLKSMTPGSTTTEQTTDGDPLHKSLTEQLTEIPEVRETVDATPFLKRLASSLDAMLDNLHQDLTKSENSRRQFNVGLAKALYGVGKVVQSTEALVKSMQAENAALKQRLAELGQRVDVVETQPLPFKGRTGTRPLKKSFGGGGPVGNDGELTPEQIDQGLDILLTKSMTEGDPPGVNLTNLIAKAESAHRLAPNELAVIKQALTGNGQ